MSWLSTVILGYKYVIHSLYPIHWRYLMRRPCDRFDCCRVFTILLLRGQVGQVPYQQLVIITTWCQVLMVRRPLQTTHLLIRKIVFFNLVCSLTGLFAYNLMLTGPLREERAQVFATHVFCPPEGKPAMKHGVHCTQLSVLQLKHKSH